MKLRILTTAILVGAIELVQLAAVRPSLSQTDLNTQLQQAVCAQNWGRAIQVVDQMKRLAGPEYDAQLTLYRGQLEVFARENAKIAGGINGIDGCSASNNPSGSTPINSNTIPATPSPSSTDTPYNRGYAPTPR